MYPPATGPTYKQVLAGGFTIHRYYLAAGTQVGHDMWDIAKSNEIFGLTFEKRLRWEMIDKGCLL